MAIPDLASPFWDSRLSLFYRGSLEFPRTRTQKLLKTKDVAVRDRQIGVGPERVQRAPRTKSDEKCYLCAWHKVLPDVPVCSPICVPVQSEFVQGRTSILLAGDSGPPLMDCCTVTTQVWLANVATTASRNEFREKVEARLHQVGPIGGRRQLLRGGWNRCFQRARTARVQTGWSCDGCGSVPLARR